MPRKKTTEETTAAPVKRAAAVRKTTAAATHKAPAKRTIKAEPLFSVEVHREQIAKQAYYFWLERGGAHGGAAEDWARAEAEVRHRWEAETLA